MLTPFHAAKNVIVDLFSGKMLKFNLNNEIWTCFRCLNVNCLYLFSIEINYRGRDIRKKTKTLKEFHY